MSDMKSSAPAALTTKSDAEMAKSVAKIPDAATVLPSGMARLASLFKTDPVKEEQGTWMPVAQGVEIRVRSQQSETARNVSKQLLSRYRAALAVGASLSAEQNTDFEVEFVANALATDWKGMTDGEGATEAAMACTVENVRMLARELPHLRRQILAYSDSLENYRPDKLEK